MKITKVEVFQFHKNSTAKFRPIGCRVYTDEGIYGDGEAAIGYGIGKTSGVGAMRDFATLIIGMNPLENEIIWDKIHKTTFWAQNGGPAINAAISALDMALWDIKGKYFNVPLYVLFGGKRNSALRTYASQLQVGWGGDLWPRKTPEDYAKTALKAVAEGYDAIKIDFLSFDDTGRMIEARNECMCKLKPKYLHMAIDRIASVREAIGPDVDIIIENHSNLDALSAIQLAQAAEPYNILYFEEPNTPSPKTSKYISENINIPIANGERIYTRWQYIPYFENMSIQVAQPDLGTCGGYTEVKKVCDMAHAYDIAIQLHVCGSPLSSAASLQLECALPNFMIHEHHMCMQTPANIALCKYDYQPKDGKFIIPDLPGIGNEWSDEGIAGAEVFVIE